MPAVAAVGIPALVAGGASLIGGLGSAWASRRASREQQQAAYQQRLAMQNATEGALGSIDQASSQFQPYSNEAIAAGTGAITSLAQLYGIRTPGNPNPDPAYSEGALAGFRRSPEYTFAEGEGRKQLEAAYSKAYGGMRGGNQMRGFVEFGQGLAGTTLGNYFDRLRQISGLALPAANQQSNLAGLAANTRMNGARGIADAYGAEGAAAASGIVGPANAINAGLTGAGSALMTGYYNTQLTNSLANLANHSAYAPAGYPYAGVAPMTTNTSLPWQQGL